MSDAANRIRVLCVDDEPDVADLTATFLEREDERFAVETVTSADDGFDRLNETDFDCIVSDYNMPGRSGIEFLDAVRNEYPDLPFILYTGQGSEEIASKAISAGVTDYLQKERGTGQYTVLANRIANAVEAAHSRRQRRLFERAVEASAHSIYITDRDGTIKYVNPAFEEITGYEADEAIGQTPRILKSGEQNPELYEELWGTILDGDEWRSQLINTTKSGEQYVIDQTIAPVTDDSGEIAHFAAVNIDVTEKQARQHERTILKQAIENAHAPLVLTDPHREDNPMVYVNDAFTELTGYDEEELLGRNCRLLQGEDTDPEASAELREAIDEEESITLQLRNYRKDGTMFWNELTVAPVYDTDGTLVRFLGTQQDITERKERESRLRGLNKTTQRLIAADTREQISEIGVEAASEVLGLNANAIHLYDDERAALVPVAGTDTAYDLIDEIPTFTEGNSIAWRVYEEGEVLALDDIHDDPDIYNPETPVKSELYLPLGEHGVLIAGSETPAAFDQQEIMFAEILADAITATLEQVERTTQLRARERELEEANTLLSTLFETLPVGVTVLDSEGRITRANQRAEEVLGVTESEIIERTYNDPEWRIIDEDGESIPDDDLPFARVMATGETVLDYEHGIKRSDGTERWLSINATRLTNSAGTRDQVVTVISDITHQRNREHALREQNERLEEFASLVSHDLRNPLNVAQGRLEMVREECNSEYIDDITRAHERMSALIDDLLTLAREGETVGNTESVDLARLIENCWANVATAEATRAVTIERTVRADRSRLQQLLENLMRNTVEHGGEDVAVTIGELDNGFYVEDDGPGIPEDERDGVFEAGYSTAENGNGFGLSIVEQVADAHGWDVCVTDSSEGGARFEITGLEFASE